MQLPRKQRVGKLMRRRAQRREAQGLAPLVAGKRRGGGGAWRVFVSEARRNTRGERKADMKQLAEQYRNLSHDRKQELKEKGRLATRRHREGQRSFAKRQREVEEDLERERKRQRGQALLNEAIVPGEGVEASAIVAVDVGAQVAQIQSDAKLLAEAHREQLHRRATALKTWRATTGIAIRDGLPTAVPQLARWAPAFAGEGKIGAFDYLTWAFPADLCVPRALACLSARDERLLTACEADWMETLHSLVRHQDQPPFTEEKKAANAKWSCQEARMCLDGPRGDALWVYKVWFCRQLSRVFNTKQSRVPVNEGDIVIRLTSEPNVDSDSDGSSGGSDHRDMRDEVFRFMHISYVSWNPVKTWLRALEWPSGDVDEHGYLLLRGTHDYYVMMRFLDETFRHNSTYILRFYKLVGGSTHVEIDPHWIRVERFAADEVEHFDAPRRFHGRRSGPDMPRAPPSLDRLVAQLDGLKDDKAKENDGGDDAGSEKHESNSDSDHGEPSEDSSDHGEHVHVDPEEQESEAEADIESESSHCPSDNTDKPSKSRRSSEALGKVKYGLCLWWSLISAATCFYYNLFLLSCGWCFHNMLTPVGISGETGTM